MFCLARGALPETERSGTREYRPVRWIRRSMSFLACSLMLTIMNFSWLIAMGFFHLDRVSTGFFTAATQLTEASRIPLESNRLVTLHK